MPVVAVGSIFSDAWDAVEDVASSVVDRVGDAIKAVPGGKQLLAAADAAGELAGDFARTPVGLVVFRAISGVLYASTATMLGPILGPQLASVAFAVPGLARGDNFTEAWLTEVKYRAEETANILGGDVGDVVAEQLGSLLGKLAEQLQVGDMITESASELARRFGVREDVAALAKSIWDAIDTPEELRRMLAKYDPATGRPRPGVSTSAASILSGSDAARATLALIRSRDASRLLQPPRALSVLFPPSPAAVAAPPPSLDRAAPPPAVAERPNHTAAAVAVVGVGVLALGAALVYARRA